MVLEIPAMFEMSVDEWHDGVICPGGVVFITPVWMHGVCVVIENLEMGTTIMGFVGPIP